MGSMVEKNQAEEEEGKIPVLTVLKNKAILKNIFIVNKPPEEQLHREHEDVLLVGRHPDCDLMLTHPSISRFHLQIRSKPSSRSLSVVDLSSVHGTWVSERKIPPGVSVEMKEGDTLRVGVSSRVYRLHWIPINRAYDLENPYVSQLDVVLEQDEEEVQNLNCLAEMEEIQSVDSILECVRLLFLDENEEENEEVTVKEEIPLAPILEDIVSVCCADGVKSESNEEAFGVPSDSFGTETSYCLPKISDSENKLCDSLNQLLSSPCVDSVVKCKNTMIVEAVSGIKMQQFHTPSDTFTSSSSGLENFMDENVAEAVDSGYARDSGKVTDVSAGDGIFNSHMFLPDEEVISGIKFQQIEVVQEVAMLYDGEKQDTCDIEYRPELLSRLNSKSCHYYQGHSEKQIVQEIRGKCLGSISPIPFQIESVNSSMSQEDVLNDTKENQTMQSCEAVEKNSKTCNIWSRRGKATSAPQVRTAKSKLSTANVDAEVAMSNQKDIMNKAITRDLLPVLDKEEEEEDDEVDEIFTPDKENFSPNTLKLRFLKKKGKVEEIKHPMSQKSHKSKVNFNPGNYSDENISPILSQKNQMDATNKTASKDLFSNLGREEEEEIHTPDKENFSPNTLQLRLLKKKGKVEEIKHSNSQWSPNSKDNFGPKIYPDENISSTSNKKNQTKKSAQNQKLQRKPFSSHIKLAQELEEMTPKNRVERVPFQSLMKPEGKRSSGTCAAATKNIDFSHGREVFDKRINPSDISVARRSWDMIVDTSSLMNKESRKALQLLQGLKGTRLIVPRLVIRELDIMKRQFSIFRRISEASLALEWIEECLFKTNWWIQIQSSVEEGGLIASTPPASPHTLIVEDSWTQAFPSHKCSIEIASPTVEDHILDFAVLYKRKQTDAQLVLLSEDVSLKIKCMAEGLLCELVKEFRESLVNPFSERFLWTNSSARGQTWCCQDDVVLREKYCRFSLRKSSKGAASGLKLILLHNSQYRH